MGSCVAYNCTNRYSKKIPGITFHGFPKDEVRRKLWILAVKRKDWEPSQYSKLCSAHFSEDLMDRTSLSSVRIRENAVPNIFKAYEKPKVDRIKQNKVKPRIKKPVKPIKRKDKKLVNKASGAEILKEQDLLESVSFSQGKPKDPSQPDHVPSVLDPGSSSTNTETSVAKEIKTEIKSPEKETTEEIVGVTPDWNSLLNLQPIASEPSTSGLTATPKSNQPTTLAKAPRIETLNAKANVPKPKQKRKRLRAPSPVEPNETEHPDPMKLCMVKMEIEDDGYSNSEESFFENLASNPSHISQDNALGISTEYSSSSLKTDLSQVVVPTPVIDEPTINDSDHPVEAYFKNIAQTVMKFPPHLIEETKSKVSSLVYEMVIRAISEGANINQNEL